MFLLPICLFFLVKRLCKSFGHYPVGYVFPYFKGWRLLMYSGCKSFFPIEDVQIFSPGHRLPLSFLKGIREVCKHFCVDQDQVTNVLFPVSESFLVYFLITNLLVLGHRAPTKKHLPLEYFLL